MVQLTKPTKAIKKSVADPSDSYQSLKPLWKKSRAVLQGQENVKAHDEYLEHDYSNLLLPFSPSMTQRQYDFYKAEAELPGLTAQYCKVLISALLRKDSHLKLPEELPEDSYDWIKNNFTLDGRSLFNFLDNALWEELQTSRAWIYVDYPEITEEQFDAMSPEQKMNIKPYPVVIEAENVINIHTDTHPVTRQKTLSRLVTRYLVKRYTADNPWHPNYVDTVCDHYLDEQGKPYGNYVPYVIETSIGLDRMFLSVLSASYAEEKLEDGSERTVLKIPAALAPYKIAILPLIKKDGLPEKAQEIMRMLQLDYTIQYDEKDSIGKRYRRQDAIGTPFAITVDHETLESNTVTIRNRDTMIQERIAIEALPVFLNTHCSWSSILGALA